MTAADDVLADDVLADDVLAVAAVAEGPVVIELSGDRLWMGVGLGWWPFEDDVMGFDFATRDAGMDRRRLARNRAERWNRKGRGSDCRRGERRWELIGSSMRS